MGGSDDSKGVKKEDEGESLNAILHSHKKQNPNTNKPQKGASSTKLKKQEANISSASRVKKEHTHEAKPNKKEEEYSLDDDDNSLLVSKRTTRPIKGGLSKEKKKKKRGEEKKKVKKKTTATQEKDAKKREKKVYDLPGQKRDPPEERDPLRIFYETLYKQLPSSEMAQFWMMESGLLAKDVAQKIFEKKQKKNPEKLSAPMKAVSTSKKPNSASAKKKIATSPGPSSKNKMTNSKVGSTQSKKRKIADYSDDDDDDFVVTKKAKKRLS